jgi:hypothetical protein
MPTATQVPTTKPQRYAHADQHTGANQHLGAYRTGADEHRRLPIRHPAPTLVPTQSMTATVNVPANWQNYSGEGFELYLPPEWKSIDLKDDFEWAFSSAMVEDNPANKTPYTPIDAIRFAAWKLGFGEEINEVGMMEIYAVPASAVQPPETMAKQIAAAFDKITGPGTAKTQVVNLAVGDIYQVLSTDAQAAYGGYV